MPSLIFLLTVLILAILFIRIVVNLFQRKPVRRQLLVMCFLMIGYCAAWMAFKVTQKMVPVPISTQVCFDDWCATITKVQRQSTKDSTLIFLYITMFNNAKGIAQKPSEPRVHLLDEHGQIFSYSSNGQRNYEKNFGAQPGIGHRLELHQSMQTVLIFEVPKNEANLKALIEEGPWITDLIFPMNEQVFLIK